MSPSAFLVAMEFAGTSPLFTYSSPLWTSMSTMSQFDAAWQHTAQKTALFFAPTTAIRIEVERPDGTTSSVDIPSDGAASLRDLFVGGTLETSGSVDDWRALGAW